MKKIFWSVVIILLVLVIVAAIVLGFFLNPIVKTGVETVGPKITKTSVTLDAVDLSLLTGSVKINGLVVGNPEGYKSTNAVSVGTIAVGVNPFSLLSDKIVVRSLHVESPEITFEGGLGGNNLSKILDNVNGAAQNGGPVSTNAAGQAKPSKKIEVDDLLITGAKVHVLLTGLGGRQMTLTLPDIHLTDLGKGGDGLTATDLTRRVLQEIISATIKAITSDSANLGKGTGKLIEGAGTNVGSGLHKIENLFKH
ncbi:MAG: AsmA family protein [Limisphaerales bacterium]